MTFKEVLAQVLDWLQHDQRLSYRALKRQFALDDDALEDLKEALLYTHAQVIVDDGRGLVWMGSVPPLKTEARRGAEAESQFHALLLAVMGLLQRERRITYRTLTYLLRLDEALLEEVREELTLRRFAYDEEGKVLVWTGEAPPVSPLRWSCQACLHLSTRRRARPWQPLPCRHVSRLRLSPLAHRERLSSLRRPHPRRVRLQRHRTTSQPAPWSLSARSPTPNAAN